MAVSKYQDYVLGARVFGKDLEGNYYSLPIIQVTEDLYRNERQIEVALPFSPDHRIWPELERKGE